jgi:hypothetical protein
MLTQKDIVGNETERVGHIPGCVIHRPDNPSSIFKGPPGHGINARIEELFKLILHGHPPVTAKTLYPYLGTVPVEIPVRAYLPLKTGYYIGDNAIRRQTETIVNTDT